MPYVKGVTKRRQYCRPQKRLGIVTSLRGPYAGGPERRPPQRAPGFNSSLPMIFPAAVAGKILFKKCPGLVKESRTVSAVPPKADMCGATRNVAMGQKRTWGRLRAFRE
jgi:hypothetical protein